MNSTPFCYVCNKDTLETTPMSAYRECPYSDFLLRLHFIFGYHCPSYEIDRADGIIICYTEERVLWGRLSINLPEHVEGYKKSSSHIWVIDGSKIELFFSEHNRSYKTTKDMINAIVSDICKIKYDVHSSLAKHGVNII